VNISTNNSSHIDKRITSFHHLGFQPNILNGKQKWNYYVPSNYSFLSPDAANGLLFMRSNNTIVAIDSMTG